MGNNIRNREKSFISAVIYVRNCASGIYDFLTRLYGVLDSTFENFEIICVNDASTDDGVSVIKKAVRNINTGVISIINMSYFQGLEVSMNAGVDIAIGDFVYEFDYSVMDYTPDMIVEVYRRLLQGFDIVSAGSRRHRFSSKLFYVLFNQNTNFQYKLNTESFRIISRRAINRIHMMSKTVPYRKALYANCGLKKDMLLYDGAFSVSVNKDGRHNLKRYDTAFDAFILFTNIAYKIAKTMALMMMLVTFAGLVYTLIVYALGSPVQGYTTTMLVTTGAFFAVFFLLTVIIKYLSLLVDLVFKKQKYLIESIEKVNNHGQAAE
jgi:dolichol-phosphate mannosyltransferase